MHFVVFDTHRFVKISCSWHLYCHRRYCNIYICYMASSASGQYAANSVF